MSFKGQQGLRQVSTSGEAYIPSGGLRNNDQASAPTNSSEVRMSKSSNSSNLSRLSKELVPILIAIGIGYLEYCYCYRFCYGKLYLKDRRSAGIVLSVIYNCILLLSLVLWAQILFIGPGTLDFKVPLYDGVPLRYDARIANGKGDTPDWFLCDANGFPFWCPHCGSVKVFRAHHSSYMGSCIPRFDHYCIYIRSVIGQKNYKLFILYLFVVLVWFTYMFISVACFLPGIEDYKVAGGRVTLNPNLIMLLIGSIFWMLVTGALLVSHIGLIKKNQTTVESLQIDKFRSNSDGRRFVNFKHPEDANRRVVIEVDSQELLYDSGFYNNLNDLFGTSKLYMFLPFNIYSTPLAKGAHYLYSESGMAGLLEYEDNQFSVAFKQNILKKFEKGEGFEFTYKSS